MLLKEYCLSTDIAHHMSLPRGEWFSRQVSVSGLKVSVISGHRSGMPACETNPQNLTYVWSMMVIGNIQLIESALTVSIEARPSEANPIHEQRGVLVLACMRPSSSPSGSENVAKLESY